MNKRTSAEQGSALVIALFVLALISVFVALVLSRTAAEASAVGNETSESRTFYAAQGSLEVMTRNFNKVFEIKLNPLNSDLDAVRNAAVPGLTGNYTFTQEVDQTSASTTTVLSGGPYSGLYAIRDNWRLRATATDNATNTQVELTRNVLNNRIPIFQFGIFYDDDLELFRPPLFSFGGRVHSNGNFFVSPGAEGVYFDSRVTAVGQVVTQTWRNGYTGDSGNNRTFIKNASGVNKQLLPNQGSVLNSGGANVFGSNPDMPFSARNPNWPTQSAIFDGNLQAEVKPLKLPLKIGSNADLIEMVRRGKEIPTPAGGDLVNNNGVLEPVSAAAGTVDDDIMRAERMGNKTGFRISLADSKAKLPGCASGSGITPVSGPCGVRLDGHKLGALTSLDPSNPLTLSAAASAGDLSLASRGYQPKPMRKVAGGAFNYVPTRANGERLYTGGSREVWIKIETVAPNATTGMIDTVDITQDILSLGVTEQALDLGGQFEIDNSVYDSTAPSSSLTATTPQTASTGTDSRSVVKLQRFMIPGPAIPTSPTPLLSSFSASGTGYNIVARYTNADATKIAAGCTFCSNMNGDPNGGLEQYGHLKLARFGGGGFDDAIVPFPIEMFDTREGEYYDDSSRYTAGRVTRNGVMSMIDIDIANLRRFLRGDFDGLFPLDTPFAAAKGRGLIKDDVPTKAGWVLYISDRRGDADFDGEYDMEDVYGNAPGNDAVRQIGEDLNKNLILDAKYINPFSDACVGVVPDCEAAKYADEYRPDYAAVTDHKYYRRGVRLINGTTIPGIYDSAVASNTKGFTLASENGVYVKGNYNATGVVSIPSTGNTPYNEYLPFNTPVDIPASIVSDSVIILSNAWQDAESFYSPYDKNTWRQASDTVIRFAMISGDTIATKDASPNQGGTNTRLNGGVHNFKRFLEKWTGNNLSYSGSLINLFNSRTNNGTFKCCNTVYDPPRRNWVFDSTFLDPNRLPPGTPYFQYVQTTGFQRSTS